MGVTESGNAVKYLGQTNSRCPDNESGPYSANRVLCGRFRTVSSEHHASVSSSGLHRVSALEPLMAPIFRDGSFKFEAPPRLGPDVTEIAERAIQIRAVTRRIVSRSLASSRHFLTCTRDRNIL